MSYCRSHVVVPETARIHRCTTLPIPNSRPKVPCTCTGGYSERDPVGPADFGVAFLYRLIAWLQATNTAVDPMACGEAAGEAIVGFINNPNGYDPDRLGVEAFLRMAAQRDLQNLLRKERRHQKNRRDWNVVEQTSEDGKYLREG